MTLGRRLRGVFLVTALGACGDDSSDRSAFVDYWADSTPFCAKLADECELTSRSECVESWPDKSMIQRAVKLATLDSGDLAECERAARRSDSCFLAASCSDLNSTEPLCEDEQQQVDLDCASFLKALEIVVEDSGEPSSTSSQKPKFGERVCERIAACSDEPISDEDVGDCALDVNESFASLLPDPDAIADCVDHAQCADLLSDEQNTLLACLDIDPRTTRCQDDTMLHVCNSAGACSDIDCFGVCGAQPAGVSLCAFDQDTGYDNCDCDW
jgi:hypothetical protein